MTTYAEPTSFDGPAHDELTFRAFNERGNVVTTLGLDAGNTAAEAEMAAARMALHYNEYVEVRDGANILIADAWPIDAMEPTREIPHFD